MGRKTGYFRADKVISRVMEHNDSLAGGVVSQRREISRKIKGRKCLTIAFDQNYSHPNIGLSSIILRGRYTFENRP